MEVLIAILILSVDITSTLLFFSTAMITGDFARDVTVATSHGEYILEEMKTRNSLVDITSTDWPAWGEQQGLNTLPNENIKVDITDTFSNPIDVQVTVTWMKKLRTNDVILRTKIAL